MRRLGWIAVCLSLWTAGCTGLEPAMIGAAASGVGFGVSASRWGKINLALQADTSHVLEAIDLAVEELGLRIVEVQERKGNRWILTIRDDKRNEMTVTIDQRAAQLTYTQVNVGWFGSSAVAQLFARRVGFHTLGDEVFDG